MNKYVHAAYCVPCGMFKMASLKICRGKNFKGPKISMVSPLTEITLDKGGQLEIGENFKMRDGAKIRIRKGAVCKIGKNASVNSHNMIVCHNKVIIGNDVQFSPNVQIYDHDHNYRVEGGVKVGKYKTTPIVIGDNVWVGANTVILRGSKIGNNCVIGAGCIVRGEYPDGSLIVQKRITEVNRIIREGK